jgi:hypothetical protein
MIRQLLAWLRTLLGVGLVAGFLALPLIFFFARFGDGPLGPFPGGPLHGPIRHEPEEGWSFAANLETMQIQVGSDPPRSVTTGLIFRQGSLYAPVLLAPLARWDDVVDAHSRVIVRIDGALYALRAIPVVEPDWHEVLMEAGRRKYGPLLYGDRTAELTRFFRLEAP